MVEGRVGLAVGFSVERVAADAVAVELAAGFGFAVGAAAAATGLLVGLGAVDGSCAGELGVTLGLGAVAVLPLAGAD